MTRDWDLRANELSKAAIASGQPTAWFDQLYGAGAAGDISMPWDRDEPHVLLRQWAQDPALDATGKRAVVVGCGLGADAEYLSELGFSTTAFDIAPTAIKLARSRHPGTRVDYRVADLLALPAVARSCCSRPNRAPCTTARAPGCRCPFARRLTGCPSVRAPVPAALQRSLGRKWWSPTSPPTTDSRIAATTRFRSARAGDCPE